MQSYITFVCPHLECEETVEKPENCKDGPGNIVPLKTE
jgi:hypothetical protein